MKRRLLCLLFICSGVFCFARGKQEIIVSENFSSESRNVVVTIANQTEADFQTLVLTRKEALSDKWDLTDRRTFALRSGEAKSIVLDNQGLYKIELFDARGHKFSKKNTFSQIIKDSLGNVISEGEFQQFSQPWQKLVFTEQDFEPQATLDILEVFFGIYGNEKHDTSPAKYCSVIIVNNTGEQIEYLSVVQDGKTRSSNLAVGKGQCGVLDIKRSETADISLISRGQHVYAKEAVVFDEENLTLVFTSADREADVEKAGNLVTTVLGSITNALSITTQIFSTPGVSSDEPDEFEPAISLDSADSDTIFKEQGTADTDKAETEPTEEAVISEETEKSFWKKSFSWLPWVD